MALLEPLTQVTKPWTDPVRTAAERALQRLHAKEETPVELRKVWEKMQALEKELQELKKSQAKPQKSAAK
jgi:hypothetical protein